MYNTFLVRYGELYLKSDFVRRQFERVLVDNIRREIKKKKIKAKIRSVFGRVIIETEEAKKVASILGHTFGVVSFSPAITCIKKYSEIRKASKLIAKKFSKRTFAVEARRSDKSFPMDSQMIKKKIGNTIRLMGFAVDLSHPDNLLSIEIRDKCYIYSETIPGPGGMPLGTAGRVVSVLAKQEDLLAAWMMMKRGAEVVITGKHDKKLLAMLQKWSVGRKICVVKGIKEARQKGAIASVASGIKQKDMVAFNPLAGLGQDDMEKLYKFVSG